MSEHEETPNKHGLPEIGLRRRDVLVKSNRAMAHASGSEYRQAARNQDGPS